MLKHGNTEKLNRQNLLKLAKIVFSANLDTNTFHFVVAIFPSKKHLSDVGFEPTPTFVDQNTPVWKSFTLESGALDRSANLTCQFMKMIKYLLSRNPTSMRPGEINKLPCTYAVAEWSKVLTSNTKVLYGGEFESHLEHFQVIDHLFQSREILEIRIIIIQ